MSTPSKTLKAKPSGSLKQTSQGATTPRAAAAAGDGTTQPKPSPASNKTPTAFKGDDKKEADKKADRRKVVSFQHLHSPQTIRQFRHVDSKVGPVIAHMEALERERVAASKRERAARAAAKAPPPPPVTKHGMDRADCIALLQRMQAQIQEIEFENLCFEAIVQRKEKEAANCLAHMDVLNEKIDECQTRLNERNRQQGGAAEVQRSPSQAWFEQKIYSNDTWMLNCGGGVTLPSMGANSTWSDRPLKNGPKMVTSSTQTTPRERPVPPPKPPKKKPTKVCSMDVILEDADNESPRSVCKANTFVSLNRSLRGLSQIEADEVKEKVKVKDDVKDEVEDEPVAFKWSDLKTAEDVAKYLELY